MNTRKQRRGIARFTETPQFLFLHNIFRKGIHYENLKKERKSIQFIRITVIALLLALLFPSGHGIRSAIIGIALAILNGNIPDAKDILEYFPPKDCWAALADIFIRDELQAREIDNTLKLSWM